MHYVDLEQRTPEWFAWRRNGITATEIATVMNLNPYPEQTLWRLWCEKVGKALPPNLDSIPQVRYGREHEQDARRLFEARHAEVLLPACAEAESDPIFRCSFDGLTSSDEPVEFKCPGRTTLDKVRAEGENSDAVRFYRYQVQFQLLVSGADKGRLVFYDEHGPNGSPELIEFVIPRDEKLISEMTAAGRSFWDSYVKPRKEPPKDPLRDFYTPKSEEEIAKWCRLAFDFTAAQAQAAALQEQLADVNAVRDRCKAELAAMMGSYRCADYAGVALTKRVAKGSVDYRRFLQSKSVSFSEQELEAFRSEGSESWLIRTTGSPMPEDFIDENMAEDIKSASAALTEPMWY